MQGDAGRPPPEHAGLNWRHGHAAAGHGPAEGGEAAARGGAEGEEGDAQPTGAACTALPLYLGILPPMASPPPLHMAPSSPLHRVPSSPLHMAPLHMVPPPQVGMASPLSLHMASPSLHMAPPLPLPMAPLSPLHMEFPPLALDAGTAAQAEAERQGFVAGVQHGAHHSMHVLGQVFNRTLR